MKEGKPKSNQETIQSMAISERQKLPDYKEHEEEEDCSTESESEGSDTDPDFDMDSSYSILEEAQVRLSNLSIKKKPKSRTVKTLENDPEEMEVNGAEFDERIFEEVRKIIEVGQLKKLKVEQCKAYLRKNGLRLTGNKDTLIQRIMEHQEILNGEAEKKYPISSFVANCRGDACTGDVVMFEQNVYDTYSIISRSAIGPPCGKRIVVGRIVKESYGAAKQQHTFTIEVLWSKGEKALPPLHPLLIKGRNLYRLKTLRRRWEDERERSKVLMEKHTRGCLARSARETRIQEKEKKKMLRFLKEELNSKQSLPNKKLKANLGIQAPKPPQSGSSAHSGKATVQAQKSGSWHHSNPALSVNMGNGQEGKAILSRYRGPSSVELKMDSRCQHPGVQPQRSGSYVDRAQELITQPQYLGFFIDSAKPTNVSVESRKLALRPQLQRHQKEKVPQCSVKCAGIQETQQHGTNGFEGCWASFYNNEHLHLNGLPERNYQRQPLANLNCYIPMRAQDGQPLTSMDSQPLMSLKHRHKQQQLCRHFAKGRCYFGDNCKFSHDSGPGHIHGIL